MKLPAKKDGPKLPPPPKGGRAAARQRQFQMERGLVKKPLPEESERVEPDNDNKSEMDRKKPESNS
jgi:hypothetical protein